MFVLCALIMDLAAVLAQSSTAVVGNVRVQALSPTLVRTSCFSAPDSDDRTR